MYSLNALDIVDMIVDFEKLPMNGNTIRLRREIENCELKFNEYIDEPSRLDLEEAVKDYYQYYINCNNHALAVEQKLKKTCELDDMVNNPKHYKLKGLDVESVDVIKATLSDDEYRGWCKGNAMKYLFRAGKKDDEEQDLAKCDVYVNWAIKAMGEIQ